MCKKCGALSNRIFSNRGYHKCVECGHDWEDHETHKDPKDRKEVIWLDL